MGGRLKEYSYLDFIELFQIKDRHKAQVNWFGFKVEKSGVTLIPRDEILTPTGEDLFSLEELCGREEAIRWSPLLELRKQKKGHPPAPFLFLPPSKKPIEFIKKRIEQANKGVIIPLSPPMLHAWAKSLDNLSQPLLTFPCNEEKLRSFIEHTHLEFFFPMDHELLQSLTGGTTEKLKRRGCEPDEIPSLPELLSSEYGTKVRGMERIAGYLSTKSGKKVSNTTANGWLKNRRFQHQNVKQGGNCKGGVWAWSEALDSIVANPAGTPKKKK